MNQSLLPTQDIAQVALFAALIAALGFLPAINMPLAPITAQSLGIMLAGLCLSPRNAFLAVLLFNIAMLLGLPILSGGRGGFGMLATPSVGFIIGFPFAALTTAWIMQQLRRSPLIFAASIATVLGCIVLLYSFGILGFMLHKELSLLSSTKIMAIYIPGDLVKVVLSLFIITAIARGLPGALASRQ